MTFCFRPSPLLQETRSLTVSSDNGLVTPLPMPFSDLWDINSVPGAGLTLEYTISNISQYQGRIIYINKTQDTTGSTIELTLPGGYVFSSSGTSTLLFPDEPATLALVFSASSIVAVLGPQGPPGPTPDAYENGVFQAALNPGINFTNLDCSPSAFGVNVTQTINNVPINYQVTDTNISNNTISRINDAGSTAVVDCTSSDLGVFTTNGSIIIEATRSTPGLGFQLIATGTGATGTVHTDGTLDIRTDGTLDITSGDTAQMNITGDFGVSATQNLDIFATNGTYTDGSTNSSADLYGLTKSSITSDTLCEIWALSGDARIRTLTDRNSPDQYVSRISSTGKLFNSSVPYSRRATITDVVVPIGTADGIVYASLIYTPTGIYGRVGDIIEFTFSSIAGFDDVGSETDLFIGGHLIPSIGGGVNLLKITACLTSLVGPTYKYTVTYNNTTSGTTRLATGSFVGPAILSGLGAYLRTASFPATTVAITIDFGFLQLNRLNQAT